MLCLYWLLTVWKAPSRAWRIATLAVMALLLGLFARDQVPPSLAVLGR